MDKLQFVTLNAIDWSWTPDLHFLSKFNLILTQNLTLDLLESRTTEISFGLAFRPVHYDWVNVLFKYTYLNEIRPLDLMEWKKEEEGSHILALVPIFEFPFHIQLVEKFVWKRTNSIIDPLPEASSDLFMWINRINYHLTGYFDVGLEYRLMRQLLADDIEHGFLVELNYILADTVRFGIGYNFTSFSDNEFSDFDHDDGGFFFRVQGQY